MERPICFPTGNRFFCFQTGKIERGTAEKSTEEMPADSPNKTTPLKEQHKEILNLSKNSDGTKDTKHTFIPTPTVRNGFRRKKGDNPLVYNLNLKSKKEKKTIYFHQS